MLSPLYIAEIAPEKIRGTLVALYQLAIVVGILVVFFVNLQIQRLGDEAWNITTGWRWMFASLMLPSVLFGSLMALVPESPRWLMKMGRRDAGPAILERIGGAEDCRAGDRRRSRRRLHQEEGRWRELFTTGYRRALVIGIAAGGLRPVQRHQRHHVFRAGDLQSRRRRHGLGFPPDRHRRAS